MHSSLSNLSRRRILQVFAVLACILMAQAASASSAVLYASGNVLVNGSAVGRSSSVFIGDRIETDNSAAGTLAMRGISVQLAGGSRVVFGVNSVQLDSGAATIKANTLTSASIGGYQIATSTPTARFHIAYSNGGMNIAALEGTMAVYGAGVKQSLSAGQNIQLKATAASAAAVAANTASANATMASANAPAETTAPVEATPVARCVDHKKVDAKGEFLVDALGRYIACDLPTEGGGMPSSPIPPGTVVAHGISPVIYSVSAAAAAGTISAIVISQQNASPTGP